MFDQAEYLFNNRYYPEVIDKVFHQVQETTWDHCVNIQRAMCDHKVLSGHLTEFTLDDERNRKKGFPKGSYALFIRERLLYGHQKYILEHFLKKQELLTLREMLENERFEHQFIFHIADYTFMNLKCRIEQTGTWLVIPVGTEDGITKEQFEWMMADYNNPYTPNLWMLEIRPKVSYVYGSTLSHDLIDANNRIYLDESWFTEQRHFIRSDEMVEWKVCITESEYEKNLLRVSTGFYYWDEERKSGYLQVSDAFAAFVRSANFVVHAFIYNEGRKVGYAISPNYIGPTNYLKTCFDEYIAAVNAARLKVMAMTIPGGWVTIGGFDDQFGAEEELVTVGFEVDQCWIAIPTKDGVCPIWPGNFRVWEYDAENDTIGRMVVQSANVIWPNIYTYKLVSDCKLLLIEWFRDDILKGTNYDDFSKGYRDYVGPDFYDMAVRKKLMPSLQNYNPLHTVYDTIDLIPRLLLYGSNDYRRIKIEELLNETGLHWKDFIEALDTENERFHTLVYRMKEMPTLLANIKASEDGRARIPISTTYDVLRAYDLYIDGLHIMNTTTHWENFYQYIYFPAEYVTDGSVIIIDMYDKDYQYSMRMEVGTIPGENNLPDDYPMPFVSGNDLVITTEDGIRVPRSEFEYTLHCIELMAQVPNSTIHWDELGITPEEIEVIRRGRAVEWEDPFRSTVFRFIMTAERAYSYLRTIHDNQLMSSDPSQRLMVRTGNIIIPHEPDFSKRIRACDLGIHFKKQSPKTIRIYNANVRRSAISTNLAAQPYVEIMAFCGADDASRLMPFVDGKLCWHDEVRGIIPDRVNTPFRIEYILPQQDFNQGEVVYLPFPVDQYETMSDENGFLHLENTTVDVIGRHDMIFENGYRIPNEDLKRISNILVKVPKANSRYTIIRPHRDPEMYNFNRGNTQSIYDKMFIDSPGYREYVNSKL